MIQRAGVDIDSENSGITLPSARTLPADREKGDGGGPDRNGLELPNGAIPRSSRLARHGSPVGFTQGEQYYARLVARPALLVLSLDGTTYQRSLARAKQRADAKRGESRRSAAEQERYRNPVVIVDAGLDRAARASYPDRSAALAQGWIEPVLWAATTSPPRHRRPLPSRARRAREQRSQRVHDHRHAFERSCRGTRQPHYRVRFAFGSRLEPWVVDASQSE